jgi:hypothetical protein
MGRISPDGTNKLTKDLKSSCGLHKHRTSPYLLPYQGCQLVVAGLLSIIDRLPSKCVSRTSNVELVIQLSLPGLMIP